MRMTQRGVTAQEVVNTFTETMLARILFDYGEERHARSIARAIIKARRRQPITRTIELADIIRNVRPRKNHSIDPATRTFQALRIYVNEEMEQLEQGLRAAEQMLRPRGRLAVICFHSLEDRIVKNFLRTRTEKRAQPSRHIPYLSHTRFPSFHAIFPQPIYPTKEEIARNHRARSARLRIMERTDYPPAQQE